MLANAPRSMNILICSFRVRSCASISGTVSGIGSGTSAESIVDGAVSADPVGAAVVGLVGAGAVGDAAADVPPPVVGFVAADEVVAVDGAADGGTADGAVGVDPGVAVSVVTGAGMSFEYCSNVKSK